MKFIDKRLKSIRTEAPNLYKHIKEYEEKITVKIDRCIWKPAKNRYSCDDVSTIGQVTEKKGVMWDSITVEQDWDRLQSLEKEQQIKRLQGNMVEYLTKFTDYMVNDKFALKDMALIK